jgi:hypothetical protein
MRRVVSIVFAFAIALPTFAADNTLTDAERDAGWKLLFDGKTTNGWITIKSEPVPKTNVQADGLNPHPCNYMLVSKTPVENFELKLDYKLSPKCNSGVFFRTYSLTPQPGRDVGYNGIEIAIDDTTTAGFHDSGAIYDLVQPTKNVQKPVGEWNTLLLKCDGPLVTVDINGERVTSTNFEEWTKAGYRPDGTQHKFPESAYRDHPRKGYLGLQDHGGDCWYRNIKLRVLE